MSAEQKAPTTTPAYTYPVGYPAAYPSYYPSAYPSYYPASAVGAPVTSAFAYRAAVPITSTSNATTLPAGTTVVASSAPVYAPAPVYGSYYPGAVSSGAPAPFGSYYGHPGQQVQQQITGQEFNRGYYYDDYIHDTHSPRRSYAGFRPANAPIYEGDIIYRKAIKQEDDFVLPRRSPSKLTQSQAAAAPATSSAPVEAAAPAATRSYATPSIEVVEAKDLPTSILDKTDAYVVINVAGQTFTTRTVADAGKAARWNESFTVSGLKSGSEGTVSVLDKDKFTKSDALGTATFFVENGDRWFSLKPKGQVRLNIQNSQ